MVECFAGKTFSAVGESFLREPSAILFVVIMPPLWIAILGTIFSPPTDAPRYAIGVVQDSSPKLVEALQADPALHLRMGKLNELLQAAGKGEVLTVVQTKGEQVFYYLDDKNQKSVGAKLYVDNRIQHFFQRRDAVPTVIKPAPPHMRYVDFFIPGLLAFNIMSSSFYGVGMTVVLQSPWKICSSAIGLHRCRHWFTFCRTLSAVC